MALGEWIGTIVGPVLLVYVVLGLLRLGRCLVERRRARRPGAVATTPPIERLGADLRQLRAQLDRTENQVAAPGKAVRTRAVRAAYLDALRTACVQLEVRPPATSRVEIYRVEADLRRHGLDVRGR